jgi:hypothetical protein
MAALLLAVGVPAIHARSGPLQAAGWVCTFYAVCLFGTALLDWVVRVW